MIKQIKSLVQFSRGTSLVWDAMSTPIPDGVVAFSIDDGAFRLGDGTSVYADLATLFTFSELVSAQGGVSGLFAEPVLADNGKIVVVSFDAGSNVTSYAVSNTTLASILTSLTALEADNLIQDSAIAGVLSSALDIDVSINTGADNSIIVIGNGRYSNSGQSIASIQASISAGATFTPGCHLKEPIFYTDAAKTTVADKMKLIDDSSYYVDVVGFNNAGVSATFGLTSTNTNVSITPISGSLFKIKPSDLTGGLKDDVPVVLIATVDDGTGNATIKKAVTVLVMKRRVLACVYGGTDNDYFYATTTDSKDNIICAGYTVSEGTGGDCIVVKFDNSLNVLLKKRYGASAIDYFRGIATDSSDNIICAGHTTSEGSGSEDGLVVKFDSSLNILARKRYGSAGSDRFLAVTVDGLDNIICAGHQLSGVGGGDAMVIKFDNDLNKIAGKRYGLSAVDYFYAVTTDSLNNIICAGLTASEGTSSNCLVVKLSSSLAILAKKYYGGTSVDCFYAVTTDNADNIICVGNTGSEGVGGGDALVVKFDSSLNIVARKRYGGTGSDCLYGVVTDSLDNIICAGFTGSEGVGGVGLVIKFDSSLNILAKKCYGGSGADQFTSVTLDSSDSIVCAGYTGSEGPGSTSTLSVKLPKLLPSGTLSGTVLTGLTMFDSNLTLADSALTLTDSALSFADSSLTLADSALTLTDSTLTAELDILN